MLAPGHVAVGLTVYHIACTVAGFVPTPELYAAAALGSLLPDIDHPKSQVGRMVPGISRPVSALIGHRGFTHSLLATLLFTVLLVFAAKSSQYAASLPHAAVAALSLGYLSHLMADFLTVSGIPLFWPNRTPVRMPAVAFRTGGPIEILLTLALSAFLTWNYIGTENLGNMRSIIPANILQS